MFILFRLVRLLVFLVVILAVLGLVAFVVGRPFVERLAARSIEDRIGTPVSVSIGTSIEPGMVRGDLGSVTVKATQFERDGLKLAGARAVYRGVNVELSDLISGDVRLHYSSVGFQAQLTEAALTAYLKPILAERGLPTSKLRVQIGNGRATGALRQPACSCQSQDRGCLVDRARARHRLSAVVARAQLAGPARPAARRRPPHRHHAAHEHAQRSRAAARPEG